MPVTTLTVRLKMTSRVPRNLRAPHRSNPYNQKRLATEEDDQRGSEVPKNIAAMPKMRKTIASTMDTTVAITMSPSEAVALLLMVDERPQR